jgi:hypothetical protein
MKTKCFLYFAILPAMLLFASCQYWVKEEFVATCSTLYRTNIVGIAGEPSEAPYVEIIYSADDGHGKNVTQSIMVSPPYVFENKKVNITYDSLIDRDKKGVYGYHLVLRHSYEEGGAEYFRIVNHSPDKSVEFFLAGAQDIETLDNDSFLAVIPSVYYRNAPILYLLFPERKYHKNLVNGDETFFFEGNRCGDIELTSAWSANDVVQLYRAEHRLSPDTILYVDVSIPSYSRMSRPADNRSHLANRTFYGTISPGEQFKGDTNFWLLATAWMFDDYFTVRRF